MLSSRRREEGKSSCIGGVGSYRRVEKGGWMTVSGGCVGSGGGHIFKIEKSPSHNEMSSKQFL